MSPSFRHPKTQCERKGDHALDTDRLDADVDIKARSRGKKKGQLPTDRDDIQPSTVKDRWRGRSSKSRVKA